MSIQMGINPKLWLSPIVYSNLQSFAKFKGDFRNVFMRAWKDPMKTCHKLPYLAIDDVIFAVLESWPLEWRAATGSTMEIDKSTVRCKKEETKL